MLLRKYEVGNIMQRFLSIDNENIRTPLFDEQTAVNV